MVEIKVNLQKKVPVFELNTVTNAYKKLMVVDDVMFFFLVLRGDIGRLQRCTAITTVTKTILFIIEIFTKTACVKN